MIFTALDATDVLKVYAEQVIQQQETIGCESSLTR
jgi:hypothetical protein